MNESTHKNEDEIQDLQDRLTSLKRQRRESEKNPYIIPISILVSGVLVAGAIFFSQGSGSGGGLAAVGGAGDNPTQHAPPPSGSQAAKNVAKVTAKDHIVGNPDAAVKIIEFSDTECPFCKRLHETLNQVMDEYGKDGKVAWVYRHFPLTSLHSKAQAEAEATECAAELGGNAKFWAYINRLFEITPSNNRLELSELPNIAEFVGLDRAAFEACQASGEMRARVQAHYDDAVASGGSGTPYSIIVGPNGETFPVIGAQPYESLRSTIEAALNSS